MAERQNQNAAAPPPAAGGAAAIRLTPFWSNSPAAWFRTAEAQFNLRNVTDPMEKFYVVLSALTEATVDRVRHVVEAEPDENSYTNLKDGLLASHVMTDYQKIDKLLQLEPLNGRKPSDMLVEMERLKPADNEQYFAFMFLQRLPREVRVLLSGEPIANMRLLAEKADALMALHQPQQHDVAAPVAAATPDGNEECVTAVKAGGKSGGKSKYKKKQKNQRSLSPSDERKSPLCWLHIRFGDKARRCEQPCAWPAAEN
jgi:hypothetical protein